MKTITRKGLGQLMVTECWEDQIKDEIRDGYAKGKINEQHYKLLTEEISD